MQEEIASLYRLLCQGRSVMWSPDPMHLGDVPGWSIGLVFLHELVEKWQRESHSQAVGKANKAAMELRLPLRLTEDFITVDGQDKIVLGWVGVVWIDRFPVPLVVPAHFIPDPDDITRGGGKRN